MAMYWDQGSDSGSVQDPRANASSIIWCKPTTHTIAPQALIRRFTFLRNQVQDTALFDQTPQLKRSHPQISRCPHPSASLPIARQPLYCFDTSASHTTLRRDGASWRLTSPPRSSTLPSSSGGSSFRTFHPSRQSCDQRPEQVSAAQVGHVAWRSPPRRHAAYLGQQKVVASGDDRARDGKQEQRARPPASRILAVRREHQRKLLGSAGKGLGVVQRVRALTVALQIPRLALCTAIVIDMVLARRRGVDTSLPAPQHDAESVTA